MVLLNGNFALGCGPGTDYPLIHIFQCMLERKNALTKEVLEPITFVLAYPTTFNDKVMQIIFLLILLLNLADHNFVCIICQLFWVT
jgi:hypothetical protein